MCQIHISKGKRKSKRVDSDEDIPHQKQQVYDHSTSSDEDSRSSSKYGKEPAGGRHYTKKGKLKRRPKELKGIIIASINLYIYFITGNKRQRLNESNSDEHQSSSKRKAYSKGSDSSHDSN